MINKAKLQYTGSMQDLANSKSTASWEPQMPCTLEVSINFRKIFHLDSL